MLAGKLPVNHDIMRNLQVGRAGGWSVQLLQCQSMWHRTCLDTQQHRLCPADSASCADACGPSKVLNALSFTPLRPAGHLQPAAQPQRGGVVALLHGGVQRHDAGARAAALCWPGPQWVGMRTALWTAAQAAGERCTSCVLMLPPPIVAHAPQVLYLASLIRSITALHDLIDNKQSRQWHEKQKVGGRPNGRWLGGLLLLQGAVHGEVQWHICFGPGGIRGSVSFLTPPAASQGGGGQGGEGGRQEGGGRRRGGASGRGRRSG